MCVCVRFLSNTTQQLCGSLLVAVLPCCHDQCINSNGSVPVNDALTELFQGEHC